MAPASLDEGGHGVIPLPESDYTLNHHRAQQHSLRGVPPPSQAPLIPTPDDGIALNPPSNIRGMKNKRWRPSDNQWNDHKNTIQRLYISENLSLDATMKFMGEHHTFWASKRMYKEQLAEWGFRKNLKKDEVKGIIKRTRQREGRKTEVRIQGQLIPLHRIEKAYERQFPGEEASVAEEEESISTNMPGVAVLTPGAASTPGGITGPRPAALDSSRTRPLGWSVQTPSAIEPGRGLSALDMLRNNGRGLPLPLLYGLKREGQLMKSEGDFHLAENKLREALGGFRYHLSHTHPVVAESAYGLASCLGDQERMREADDVLNWLSAQYCTELGLWHPRTLEHYIRIFELLQDWSRDDFAKLMAHNIYETLRDGSDRRKPLMIPILGASRDLEVPEFPDTGVLDQLFTGPRDDKLFETQIWIAGLWSVARLPGTQDLLSRLVSQCEEYDLEVHADGFPLQLLRARLFLIKEHCRNENQEHAEQEATQARTLLAKVVSGAPGMLSKEALTISRELAFLHITINDPEGCKRILSRMADRLEDLVSTQMVRRNISINRNCLNLIKYLIHVGLAYQRLEMKDNARSWFERASAVASRLVGSGGPLTQFIEHMIHHEFVDEGVLLTSEELSDMVDVFP